MPGRALPHLFFFFFFTAWAVPPQPFTAPGTGHNRTVPGTNTQTPLPRTSRLEWGLAALGVASLLAAVLVAPSHARATAAQDWPAFVLVAGLLLVGLVAEEDGLFEAGGRALALVSPNGLTLLRGAALLVVTVTTLLNLDTSVTFLTPVLVSRARGRGEGEAALLYACLLLSNAGSLMLPGSNLTNLIVLGHLHLSGGAYFAHMALPAVGAAVVTALVVGAVHHRTLRADDDHRDRHAAVERPELGVGLVAVAAVTVLVVVLRAPALPVAAVGVGAVVLRSARRGGAGSTAPEALRVLGLPVLIGLFGLAVALGTLGRSWSGRPRFSRISMPGAPLRRQLSPVCW